MEKHTGSFIWSQIKRIVTPDMQLQLTKPLYYSCIKGIKGIRQSGYPASA
ncbi:hypothetical protein C5167_039649 [Papaver somniferum]|uniref:Uncharacterized protein n=1 Tax=Papaver somniferum TaxID=3469 RepID=A0A4Y7IG20_PAPSO|nr:hypothetical protein C5167_039649 [Papaver somniferum]